MSTSPPFVVLEPTVIFTEPLEENSDFPEVILTDPEAFADYDIDRGCIARLWCRRAGDSHAELARRAPAEDHAEAVNPFVSRLGISGRQLSGRNFAFA